MSLPLVLLAAALTGGAIAYVISPLLWPERAAGTGAATGVAALPQLLERRDAAYAAIRELDEGWRLGKLEPDVYRAARQELEDDAARALQALDAAGPPATPPPAPASRRRGAEG